MTERVDAKAALEAMRNSAFCPGPWTEALQQTLADLEAVERTTWECGCGWINGVNLASCAQCRRTPADLAALKEKP